MSTALKTIGIVAAILALTWAIQGNDFFLYKYFAPRQEAVRRQVFKQSQAYNDGMSQDLSMIQREYSRADDAQKQTLAAVVYHRFADFDDRDLPTDQRKFLDDVRYYQTHTGSKLP